MDIHTSTHTLKLPLYSFYDFYTSYSSYCSKTPLGWPNQFLGERRIYFLGCYCKIDHGILQVVKCLCPVLDTQFNIVSQNRVLEPIFVASC